MATINDSSIKFFSKAKSDQWLFVLAQYKKVFEVRAQATRGSKKSGPQEAIKLDNWYQEELPKLLQSRKHVIHEELVQITKWKLWRTKNRAGLLDLVRMNTELAVKQVSTKAFKKCPTNLQGAISALVNLKGIGVATASAILCACFPEICPFMADECLDSVPGIENTNYTVNEFIAFADQIKACCERLQAEDPTAKWTPHKVELTLWTHYWIKEMKLNLLDKMPTSEGVEDETEETGSDDVVKSSSKSNGDSHVKLSSCSSTNGSGSGNGDRVLDEDSNISVPVSNASEVEESKSNEEEEEEDEDDDSRSADVVRNNNGTNRMSKNNRNIMNNNSNTSNSNSAYNCIEDSKDGMRVDENSRQQLISNGDNSNLSYSNLSSDDLNNSTTENTADNTSDAPTNLTTSNNMNNIMNTTSSSNVSTTCSLSPLPPPPPPPVAAIAVPVSSVVSEAEADGEAEAAASVSVMELAPQSGPVTVTNNGYFASNGESCKNIDNNDSEIISDTVGSSVVDDLVSSNNIKRPLEEITSSVDGLQDNGSLDKKSRIE